MKRSMSLIAAIAALALVSAAQAGPEDQAVGQPSPATQAAMVPSTDPGVPPSAQSSGPSAENVRLAALVPAGMSAAEACSGFRSTGECAATLHAARNLGLPFSDLKSKVTGGQKLGAAIKELKPGANVKAEVRKAEDQARADASSPRG